MWYQDLKLKSVLQELHQANNEIYCMLTDATGMDGIQIVFVKHKNHYKITVWLSSLTIDEIITKSYKNDLIGVLKGITPEPKFEPKCDNMIAWLENRYSWEIYNEKQQKKKAKPNSFTGGYAQNEGKRGSHEDWSNAFKEKLRQNTNSAKASTPHEILGLNPLKKPTAIELKNAYRNMCMKWHPDKNQHQVEKATEMMKEINNAYRTLKLSYGYT